MLGNYLAAALRNLGRNRLHTAITTLSLAIGFAAVIFAALYWRYEHSYDRFWPDADRLFLAGEEVERPNRDPETSLSSPATIGPLLKDVSGVEAAARAAFKASSLARGRTAGSELQIMWADAGFFDLFPMRSVAGDPAAALAAPGGIVLTESLAKKYFGNDDPIGQSVTLTPNRPPGDKAPPTPIALRVTAVIEDLPRNSHLQATGFVSGLTAGSPLSTPGARVFTYFRLRPGAGEETFATLLREVSRRGPPASSSDRRELRALPVGDVYMPPASLGDLVGSRAAAFGPSLRQSGPQDAIGLFVIAGLLLAIASINFVTLMTARGARRAVEVGVRKAAGARRIDLVLQFIGEALVLAGLALVLGLALIELLSPWVAKVLERPIGLDDADAGLLLRVLAGALSVGALAGVYPALALSSFKPVAVLKGGLAKTPGSARLRQILIALQFTPLILLAISAVAGDRQRRAYADNSYRRLAPYTLIIEEPCAPDLRDRIAALPGVRSATCAFLQGRRGTSTGWAVNFDRPGGQAKGPDGKARELSTAAVDVDDLDFHGLRPIAGAVWPAPGDPGILINATAARDLGLSPRQAVGRALEWRAQDAEWKVSTIRGVVNDRGGFPGVESLILFPGTADPLRQQIGVRLTDRDVPATLAAIDALWTDMGRPGAMKKSLWRDEVEQRLAANRQESQFTHAVLAVCVLLATLGLFGLAAFLAEQRTKEVGVRKALGAGRGDLLALLVLQFVKPVLIANVLAIGLNIGLRAVTDLATPRAFRSALALSDYGLVAAGSLSIAVLATFLHAWRVSATRPVTALRYE